MMLYDMPWLNIPFHEELVSELAKTIKQIKGLQQTDDENFSSTLCNIITVLLNPSVKAMNKYKKIDFNRKKMI